MKTENRPVSSGYGRASGGTPTTQQGEPPSPSRRQQQQQQQRASSATRLASSTYFDIASTILGSAGDLDDLLLSAARDGDYNKVEQLMVKRGDIIVDIDCKEKRSGNTPLIWAAKKGHIKILQLLLRHGADPTLRNNENKTAVEEATGRTVTILLDSVTKASESSHRLLLQAAWQGNIAVIRRLLSNKVLDINCQNADGLTPLILVARDIQMFELLSRDVNMPYNPVEVAQELMKARADIHTRDSDGRSCLHYASQSMASVADKMVQAFLGGGSEPDLLDKRQYMPIHWASQHGNTSVILALLDGGSEVNCRGFIGLTPLHISAHNDNQCTALALLAHGADVTLVDDRGYTAVDLARNKKLKTILKEAWSEATQNITATELAPIRATPSHEGQGSKSSGREQSPARHRGEVNFDGTSSNMLGAQRGSQAGRANMNRSALAAAAAAAERSRRADRQMLQDIESGRYTPSLLHGRDITRPLGMVRNKPGPPVLPNISRAIPLPAVSGRQSPESPTPSRRSSQEEELRHSLEDGRNLLSHRASAKRALPMRGRLCKTTPLSTVDKYEQGEDSRPTASSGCTHRRTGSDPYTTKITDIAASLESIINNRKEITSMTQHCNMSTQVMSLPPTSNRILPPTPTFMTQRSYLESVVSRIAGRDDDSSSSKEPSPRSDDEGTDKFRVGVSNPLELLRSRSLLKEEFILAESRPSDHFMTSSGSDPASSSSSLSTASSSPREGTTGLGRPALRRTDHPLLSLTLREKAMKGTGFRKGEAIVVRRTDRYVEETGDSTSVEICTDKPVDSASVKSLKPSVESMGRVTRSQSLRLSQRPPQQTSDSSTAVGCGNLKRSQSSGCVPAESAEKHAAVKDSAFGRLGHDGGKGAPFSGKGRIVVVHDTFGDFDNVFDDSDGKCVQPKPFDSTSGVCTSAKKSSEAKPESAYIRLSSERSQASSSEGTPNETPRMSVSDVAIGGVNQPDFPVAQNSSLAQATPRRSRNTCEPNPPVPNSQSANDSVKAAGQKTAVSQSSRQADAASKGSAHSSGKTITAASDVQTGEVKCSQLSQAGISSSANTRASQPSYSKATHPSTRSHETNAVPPSTCQQKNGNKVMTPSRSGGTKGNSCSASSAMSTSRTASASGGSLVAEPTISRTGPDVSSSTAAAQSEGPSSAQRSRPPGQSSAVRKSASTESLSTARTRSSTQDRQASGETGRKNTLSSSQQTLSSSARDVTGRLSGSASSSVQASNTPRQSYSRYVVTSSPQSNTSHGGRTSGQPVPRSTAPSVLNTGSQAARTQVSVSKSVPSPATASSMSKPVVAVSAATPGAVARISQSGSAAAARSVVNVSSPGAGPGLSGKNMASSSIPLSDANTVASKTASSVVADNSQGKGEQTSNPQTADFPRSPMSARGAKQSSDASVSGGLKDQNSEADIKVASTSGSSSSTSRSSVLVKSSSDHVLGEKLGKEKKRHSDEKVDTGNSYVQSGEGIEPLVKITFSGMTTKPSANISKYSDPLTLVNTGPVIVNPFENLSVHNASREKNPEANDASMEVGCIGGKPDRKKPPTSAKAKAVKKGAKKGRDSKRPTSSSSRQTSAGKQRGTKGKDSKTGDSEDARPKSGKRVRSGKRHGKKAAERQADKEAALLREMATKGHMALISGIGWHVATTCADTSDVVAASKMHIDSSSDSDIDISDVESIEDAETLMTKLEVNRSNISLSSPRFREIRSYCEKDHGSAIVPALTSDGFRPMNLDVTQKDPILLLSQHQQLLTAREDVEQDHIISDFEDIKGDVHGDLLRMLTPIPEMPSLSCPMDNVTEAIARFDRSLKDNQLSELLEGKSRIAPRLVPPHEPVTEAAKDSFSDDRVMEGSGKKRDIVPGDSIKSSRATHVEVTKPSASSKDSRQCPRRTQSLKEESGTYGKKERPRRERKFSESKKDEEEINNAIEEIFSATGTSLSSTLRSTMSTLCSASNTLTEGNHSILLKPKSHSREFPFHATKPVDDDDDNASMQRGDDSGDSGDGFNSKPRLLRVMHLEEFDLGAKVKAMIDAGADESKIKAMMDADEDVKQQEARQIVKVMNSFRHMELHAGSSHNTRDSLLKSESHRVSRVGAAVDKVPLVRPSSAGAARSRGRFQELKKASAGGSSQQMADRTETGEEPVAYTAVVEAMAVGLAADVLGDSAASETMCSRLSRHSSRAGSACTDNSQEEETIQWKKGNVLGKGAFGTVWCGLTNEGQLIAVKQIELNTADRQKAEREYEKVQEEVELLKTLNHSNIVGYLGTSLEDSTVSIFMQFVPGGSIASILARFGALDETVFRRYTRQILQGVEYLHNNDVIHRDIKGGNVMLMPNGVIKLIDFGCAKRLCINLSLSQSQILRSMKGTPYWMAPEVVNESGHGKKSDIWSIGCTVFEMATRKPPWADMNPMAAIFAIGSDRAVPKLPAKFSAEAIAFVTRCLTRDQQERPSATELLTDVFMAEQLSKK